MVRFLTHPSAGVKGFDQMPATWTSLVSGVLAGGVLSANSPDAKEVIGAWHQEVRDLSLTLSRQLGTNVRVQIPRAHGSNPMVRLKADIDTLARSSCLNTTLVVPNAAAPISICADIQKRSVIVSMGLRAPANRKSTKARVTWLLRQLQQSEPTCVHMRLIWPGRATTTQYPLEALREDLEIALAGKEGLVVQSFEVLLAIDLGSRFARRRNFVTELEAIVPEFYERVGQHLKAWQPSAPRLNDEKAEPAAVTPEALREKAEAFAAEGRHSQDSQSPTYAVETTPVSQGPAPEVVADSDGDDEEPRRGLTNPQPKTD